MRQTVDKGAKWCLSSEQVGWTECSFVRHVPGPRGNSLSYIFLPQQGIVSMFFSGVGRQPISVSPALALNDVGMDHVGSCLVFALVGFKNGDNLSCRYHLYR